MSVFSWQRYIIQWNWGNRDSVTAWSQQCNRDKITFGSVMTMLSVFLAKAINFYGASFHPREWIFLPYLNFWFHTWGWCFCFCQIQVCLLQPVGKVFWVSKICWCLKLSYFTSKVMWFKLLYIVMLKMNFHPTKLK